MAEAAAAAKDAVDDFVFSRQVVLADGQLDGQESYLMRKLANLLQLEPAFLSQARQRIQQDGL